MNEWSERKVFVPGVTVSASTGVTTGLDVAKFAGGAVLMPSNFGGTLALQAKYGDTFYNYYDKDGNLVQYADTYAGAMIEIAPAMYPLQIIRFARTNGAGSVVASGTAYSLGLVFKT